MHSRGPSGSLDQLWSTVQWLLQVRLQILPFWAKDGIKSNLQASNHIKLAEVCGFQLSRTAHTHHASQVYCLAKKLMSNLPTKADTVFHCPTLSPLSARTSKMEVVCAVSPESLLRTKLVVDPSTVISL